MKKEILERVYSSQKSLIVNGGIATGKTTKVGLPLVGEMIKNKESLFILDPKEEYISAYYQELKENNYNIIVLNLRDFTKSEGWNPLEYPYELYKSGKKSQAVDYIEKIGKTIFFEDSSIDTFWSSSASDFFTGLVLGLFEDGKKEEINLNSINSMFNGIDKKIGRTDFITSYFQLKGSTSPAYVYASTTFSAPNETKGGIVSVAKQKLRLYVSREELNVLLNKTTFEMKSIVEKPTAIFFIGKDEGKVLNTICSLFVEQLYSILVDLKSNQKFNFILDNFDTLNNVNELTDMVGAGVSRNIKFIIGTRSIEDMQTKYGEYLLKLCDLITLNNKKIVLKINGEEIPLDNLEPIKLEKPTKEILYPELKNCEIKLFDLDNFVYENKKDEIMGSLSIETNKKSFEELLKEIDEKIAKLDAESKEEKE